MKCADLPDDTVIATVRDLAKRSSTGVACFWDLEEELWDVPVKLVRAKVQRLVKRGLLHGCVHGTGTTCRGDLHVPEPGKACPAVCGRKLVAG